MFEDHAVPVVLAFQSEFFFILADFIKACKGSGRGLPSPFISAWIPVIVGAAWATSQNQFD
eukprot:CAMPEP_0113648094 /NCGR_PEP_ID=MMETSP0017_2-20120614/25491_1 /TAXON_ID=2856 /ORGANISM="Cylindrotheca closterium" /LENGTH=60 /DNA_ID=CAMNT_0000560255 /DNA_START=84 /DNA_END=263 /DNA_ORIENTATION=+ /assembly_acc=CAM_ASM_000147